jgi:TatA/E family protein of Tat protein translocase
VLNLDPAKLLIIAVVAIILLGPDKLPQVARQAGAAWRSFNDFRHRMENEVRNSIPDLPSSTEIARLARSPTALLDHLSNMAPDGTDGSDGTESANGGPSANGAAGVAETSAEGPLAEGTSAEHQGYESPTNANGVGASTNGNAAGHPPMTSVPPTSTIPTPAPAPVDPSLN